MRTLLLVAAVALLAVGCKPENPTAISQKSNAGKVFRVGYQKGGALQLLRVEGDLDKRLAQEGVKVEWVQFASAPPMLEAIGVGSLDIGSGGDGPLVFAQAAGHDIALLANTPPGDNDSRGVIVPANSPAKSLSDLKGKRIAVTKGTGTHNFLIQALDRAGVNYSQIQPIYLSPPDARAAFDAGKVDAWAAWDPYLTVATKATGARTLVNGGGITTAGGFYFSTKTFARQHPEWVKALLEEVDKKSTWLWQHPKEAAQTLSPVLNVDVATLEAINRNTAHGRQYVGFRPVEGEVIKAQQLVADNFFRVGLLPKKIDVRETLLTEKEYAAILPDVSAKKVAGK
ncbi:MAG: aliphatic sulfonate ABC transporter substrate-binding protein [Armatimonas sp.]